MRRTMSLVAPLAVVLLSGCLFGSPSASPSRAPSASVTPTPEPLASLPPPTPTVAPTPGPDKVPIYTAGTRVVTGASGLRVRSGPGTRQGVLTLLPTGSKLLIELGPVRADGHGWYLVLDADAAAPAFKEGWVAAGFAPNPYLVPSNFELPSNPVVAGFAHQGNGEFGPVPVSDANYGVRWVASVVSGASGCSFSADFVPGAGTAVPAIRATIGAAPAPGSLYADFFTKHPDLTGDLFVRVTSDCSWAITFVRSPLSGT